MYKDNINNEHNYNTPLYLFNYLNKHFDFVLDPCDSGNMWLDLDYNFTKEDDGLKQEWIHNAFVNPPYGNGNEEKWVNKSIDQYNEYGQIIFLLLPSKTEASWFCKAANIATITIFPQKRISFIKDRKTMNSNIMGSVLFGFIMTRDREYNKTKREWEQLNSFIHENIDTGVPSRGSEEVGYYFYPDRDLLKEKYS